MDEKIRLNKFLAEREGLSRRQADDLIGGGKVTVNGKTAILGQRIDNNDEVCYNGKIVPFAMGYTYLGLNKPVGYVCSRRAQGDAPTIYELLPEKYRTLKTVGRLDRDSSGIIILTNDGDYAFKMTHPSFQKTKVYEVEIDSELAPLHQQEIADFGIEIGDGRSRLGLEKMAARAGAAAPAGGEAAAPDSGALAADGSRRFWRVTMTEGRNRQIRRTFLALGYNVVKLHRVQFGPYQLSGLKPGEFIEVKKA